MTTNDTVRTIGFARYRLVEGAQPEALLDAVQTWRRGFLDQHPGILGHRLLGNLRGDYADVMLAASREAFDAMAAAHPESPSSRELMQLLDPSSIILRSHDVLGEPMALPDDFGCVEYGSFAPKPGGFTDDALVQASTKVERGYLSHFDDVRAHAIGKVDDTTYAEISFVRTLGAARPICQSYVDTPACADLLGLFDPDSVDLDFWFVLA